MAYWSILITVWESMRLRRAKDSGRRSRMDAIKEEGFKVDEAKGERLVKHNKKVVDEREQV